MSPVAISPSPASLNGDTYAHIPKHGSNTLTSSASSFVSSSATSQPTLSTQSTQPWRPRQVHAPKRTAFTFDSMRDALEAFANGEFLVVMDDEHRENEGDLIIAGSQCTPEKMAWMIKHTSGYVCCALPGSRLKELQLPMMVPDNQDHFRTAYTITVDYKLGTTTGISAHDRSLTVRALASPHTQPSDFIRPGHMVPLCAREGGVLTREGHTEASIDLCLLTNQAQAGVLCELVNDDLMGTMARRDDCRTFADRWGLKMISVKMLAEYKKIWLPQQQQAQNGTTAQQ